MPSYMTSGPYTMSAARPSLQRVPAMTYTATSAERLHKGLPTLQGSYRPAPMQPLPSRTVQAPSAPGVVATAPSAAPASSSAMVSSSVASVRSQHSLGPPHRLVSSPRSPRAGSGSMLPSNAATQAVARASAATAAMLGKGTSSSPPPRRMSTSPRAGVRTKPLRSSTSPSQADAVGSGPVTSRDRGRQRVPLDTGLSEKRRAAGRRSPDAREPSRGPSRGLSWSPVSRAHTPSSRPRPSLSPRDVDARRDVQQVTLWHDWQEDRAPGMRDARELPREGMKEPSEWETSEFRPHGVLMDANSPAKHQRKECHKSGFHGFSFNCKEQVPPALMNDFTLRSSDSNLELAAGLAHASSVPSLLSGGGPLELSDSLPSLTISSTSSGKEAVSHQSSSTSSPSGRGPHRCGAGPSGPPYTARRPDETGSEGDRPQDFAVFGAFGGLGIEDPQDSADESVMTTPKMFQAQLDQGTMSGSDPLAQTVKNNATVRVMRSFWESRTRSVASEAGCKDGQDHLQKPRRSLSAATQRSCTSRMRHDIARLQQCTEQHAAMVQELRLRVYGPGADNESDGRSPPSKSSSPGSESRSACGGCDAEEEALQMELSSKASATWRVTRQAMRLFMKHIDKLDAQRSASWRPERSDFSWASHLQMEEPAGEPGLEV